MTNLSIYTWGTGCAFGRELGLPPNRARRHHVASSIVGFEDGEIPGPAEVFFYLFRGSPGSDSGPGSYGQGSSGRERIAASGNCPQAPSRDPRPGRTAPGARRLEQEASSESGR